jgi:hypothetical protein
MIFRVPAALIKRCKYFANASVGTTYKMWSHDNTKMDKMKEDIIIGKLGECAISSYLKMRGYAVNEPSFEVLYGRQKSFAADLVIEPGIKIHCKAQSEESVHKYGLSWLIQYSDIRKDPIVEKANELDYLALAVVKDDGIVEVLGIFKVKDIVKNKMLKDPKVAWFHKTKRAIYWDDIKTLKPAF